MKKLFLFMVPVFVLASCGGSGSSSDDVFYDTASKVLPNINTTLVSGVSIVINETSDNVCNDSPAEGTDVKTICDTFEAYTIDNWNNEEETLGHRVGMTNFYKFIIQTDAYISDGLRQTCETVSGKVKVLYDDNTPFWESTDNYVCKATYTESTNRFKAYAWDQTNNKYAVMYDHQDANDEALTFGSKAANSFDLTVKFFGESGGYRRFTGDSTEQTFTMQDLKESNYKLALAGFAQGEGKHFLAKSFDGATTKFYCFTINSQKDYTTSTGQVVTVITGLTYTEEATCTTAGGCGGCENDSITIDGTTAKLPDAIDTVIDMTGVTVPSQHFKHEFSAL